jgi:thiamine pyrophosphate-dependent acetolactate synthase large subunit-like protein
MFWDQNYSKTCLREAASCAGNCREASGGCPNAYWPDLVRVAEANGMRGVRVERPSDVAPALTEGFAAEGPMLMEIMVDKFANVYPMVSAGSRLDDIIFGRI